MRRGWDQLRSPRPVSEAVVAVPYVVVKRSKESFSQLIAQKVDQVLYASSTLEKSARSERPRKPWRQYYKHGESNAGIYVFPPRMDFLLEPRLLYNHLACTFLNSTIRLTRTTWLICGRICLPRSPIRYDIERNDYPPTSQIVRES
jgi:hypothetical protein